MATKRRRAQGKRRARYGLGDFTDDSLEMGQMAVIRASRAGDCAASKSELEKLKSMGAFAARNEPRRQKDVDRIVRNTEGFVAKACKV